MFRLLVPAASARILVLLPVVAALVSGCSMAGLPAFKPAATASVAETATVAEAGAAPIPMQRPEGIDLMGPIQPMAYASPVTSLPARAPAEIETLIIKYALAYDVPASLIHRVVKRESGYNPRAHHGQYYGLMQIRPDTARSMGYGGSAEGLLDADTNLRYAVKYLRGAYVVGGYNSDAAVRFYARGYYYDAKRLGLLEEIGLR